MLGNDIRRSLQLISLNKDVDFQVVLKHYYLEQFARRIAVSKYNKNLIFKGGFVVSHLSEDLFRATSDIDLVNVEVDFIEENLYKIFEEICEIDISDSINYKLVSIKNTQLDGAYGGFEIKINYEKNCNLTLDINCNSMIDNSISEEGIVSFIGADKIDIKSQRVEMIFAEKFETIISKGDNNTRMKDFADIYSFIKLYNLDLDLTSSLIKQVCMDRQTTIDKSKYIEVINSKLEVEKDVNDWKRYIKNEPHFSKITFHEVIDKLLEFINENI